jgi:hypothetical protein
MSKSNLLQRLAQHFHLGQPAETLTTLFHRTVGKHAAKWHGYLQHYDRHFEGLKGQPLRILEIGIQAGGSLEIWAEYFKEAKLIIGCDIDSACGDLHYADPRIKVLIGDINTVQTLQSLAAITDTLDIVIDDGSHHSNDIIRSFAMLFPCLADGGTYLIEDLHCSYWENYGGGLHNPFSAISFFKKIVDIVNRPVWGMDVEAKDFFSEFKFIFGESTAPEMWQFLADIYSIEFVNSMCVIHKRSVKHNVLGLKVLSGSLEAIAQSPYKYVASEMSVPDQSGNILSKPPTLGRENQLLLAREEIARLKEQNIALTTQFYESTKKFYDASVTIQQLEFKLKQLEQPNQDES